VVGTGPVFSLYVPATHDVHGPPSSPVTPALQVQLVTTTAAGAELELVGQAAQEDCILPTPVLNVLNGQVAHAFNVLSPLCILSLISVICSPSSSASTTYKPATLPCNVVATEDLPTFVFLKTLSCSPLIAFLMLEISGWVRSCGLWYTRKSDIDALRYIVVRPRL